MISPQYGFSSIVAIALIAGVSDAGPPRKLVGGLTAEVGEFTYMASVRKNGKHICGGSIVDERHVVTAAHCVSHFSSPYNATAIMTGTTELNGDGHINRIKSIIRHHRHNDSIMGSPYDIAIIVLKKNITFNNDQTSVALPDRPTPSGVTATMIGWGYVFPDVHLLPPYIRSINTTILSRNACLARVEHEDQIHRGHICALNPVGIGSCTGDSGGPLVYNGTLIGIGSFVYDDCARGHPDVYTNVSYFVPWIKKNIAKTYRSERKKFVPEING